MQHRAVIFDIDGVLVNSYDAHLRSWQVLAEQTGVRFTETDFVAGFGRTSRDILRQWWSLTDEAEIRRLDDRKEAIYRELVADDFPAMDGAVELIDSLRSAGFALAMGSSGPAENVQLALDRLGRRSLFGAAISGSDVRRGKPDPEIFMRAAGRLGVAAGRCMVIEDAPPGLQAARAAGMACTILLSKGRSEADFSAPSQDDADAPDALVRSLREITPGMIEQLIDARRVAGGCQSPGSPA
jgi:beta-phosphoglucomutase